MAQQLEITGVKIDQAKRTRCEVWTRVMGYHRPVSEFNLGKKGEHEERTHFVEPDARVILGSVA